MTLLVQSQDALERSLPDSLPSVRPAEAFGFLGPNGAGKTSTMRVIRSPQRNAVASRVVAEGLPTGARRSIRSSGGRARWAHLDFTRINIELTILRKKVEDLMNVRGVGEKSFLKLKPLVTVTAAKGEAGGQ